MKRETFAGLALFLAAVAAIPAQAQEGVTASEESAVVVTVAEHVLAGMIEAGAATPEFRLVVDPALLTAERIFARSTGSWDPGALRNTAEAIGAKIGSLQAHYWCDDQAPPGTCFMRGADAVFSFGAPEIDGDQARLLVRVVHRSEALGNDRAFRAEAVFRLVKRDGCWQVLGAERTSVS